MVKIALDYGHGAGSAHNRGYKGKRWKNEGDGNFYFGKILKSELELYGIDIVETRPYIYNDPSLGYRGGKGAGCELFISLHTNAANGTAEGAEIWRDVRGGKHSDTLMNTLCKTISNTLNTTNRGVKSKFYAGGNYYGVLANNKAKNGMLVEHCFHDNYKDVTSYERNAEQLAKNMARVIANHYGIKTKPGTSGDKTPAVEKKEVDLMDRGKMFLISYTDKSDMELVRNVISNYYLIGLGSQFILTKSGQFDYTGLNDYTIVNIGGPNVTKKAFTTIPKVQYYVNNDEDYKILISGQKNWSKLR